MSIPVAEFFRLPGTERCLKQAAAPVPGKSRSDLHSKNVSWLKKPIYISNEPTKFQPKYFEYFCHEGTYVSFKVINLVSFCSEFKVTVYLF
jgi:hypothetical protein